MVSKLFKAKIVPVLRQAAVLAYHPRWWSGILSTTLQRTVATNILDHSSLGNMPSPGPETPLSDLLKIAMKLPEVSCLALRND